MGKPIIVANFKSYKTESEANEWLNSFKNVRKNLLEEKQVIVCPPFTLLSKFKSFFEQNDLHVDIGSQTVSEFDEGAYTGQVNARQIKDFAKFAIVGHSEERSMFNENDQTLYKKVSLCIEYKLTPIFCIQGSETFIPSSVSIVAYEPMFAVGSGNPDTPENASLVASKVNEKGEHIILYGGSVTSQNVSFFTKQTNLSGVLVGGASLDAEEFIKIIENA